MIICVCRRVSDREIVRAVAAGCTSFDALQSRLGVGQCCGKCRDSVHEILDRHAAAPAPRARPLASPQPALHP